MILSDLEILETVREDENVEGGIAFSDASGNAYASGRNFASTYTRTLTSASSDNYYYHYYGGSSASSGSTSSSAAS